MHLPLGISVLLLLSISWTVSTRDPFSTLVAYEAKQRSTAEVGNNQYNLLPFRIFGTNQHFLQTPKLDQQIRAEVVVHWINNNKTLYFPEFDLTQKVRIVIEQESLSAAPSKAILTRQFLTQTGFKLQIYAGRRYRWRIESTGKIQKLVEIALVNKPKNLTLPSQSIVRYHKQEIQILREMRETLNKAKQVRVSRSNQIEESNVSNMWAWMSGVQMISLIGFLLVQLTLFQKFMLPTSVV